VVVEEEHLDRIGHPAIIAETAKIAV
jgi:hypothetical protein